jgi:hypothetical protein
MFLPTQNAKKFTNKVPAYRDRYWEAVTPATLDNQPAPAAPELSVIRNAI